MMKTHAPMRLMLHSVRATFAPSMKNKNVGSIRDHNIVWDDNSSAVSDETDDDAGKKEDVKPLIRESICQQSLRRKKKIDSDECCNDRPHHLNDVAIPFLRSRQQSFKELIELDDAKDGENSDRYSVAMPRTAINLNDKYGIPQDGLSMTTPEWDAAMIPTSSRDLAASDKILRDRSRNHEIERGRIQESRSYDTMSESTESDASSDNFWLSIGCTCLAPNHLSPRNTTIFWQGAASLSSLSL